jgi:uncharacterized iron-regulated membrane protein
MSHLPRLRTLWLTVHRWLALILLVLLVPIATSGALLVWHDHLDAVIHPGRYAVTGVFPVVFAVTGVMMWLRGRRGRKAIARAPASGGLQAAE